MKRLFFVYSWMLLTVGVTLVSAASIHYWGIKRAQPLKIAQSSNDSLENSQNLGTAFSSKGSVLGTQTILETTDARPLIIAEFLERHNSPLIPHDYYGKKLVEIADTHGIDFRLLPSIAMQESNLCKSIPEGTFNCLGFGIHSKGTLAFDSYEANFDRAGRELKAFYIDKGRLTPEDIMRKYTPGSNGSWAESVNQWMTEMRYNDRTKGIALKTNGNVLEFAVKKAPN